MHAARARCRKDKCYNEIVQIIEILQRCKEVQVKEEERSDLNHRVNAILAQAPVPPEVRLRFQPPSIENAIGLLRWVLEQDIR